MGVTAVPWRYVLSFRLQQERAQTISSGSNINKPNDIPQNDISCLILSGNSNKNSTSSAISWKKRKSLINDTLLRNNLPQEVILLSYAANPRIFLSFDKVAKKCPIFLLPKCSYFFFAKKPVLIFTLCILTVQILYFRRSRNIRWFYRKTKSTLWGPTSRRFRGGPTSSSCSVRLLAIFSNINKLTVSWFLWSDCLHKLKWITNPGGRCFWL